MTPTRIRIRLRFKLSLGFEDHQTNRRLDNNMHRFEERQKMRNHTLIIGVGVLLLCHIGALTAGDIKGKVKAVGAKNNANAVIYIDKVPGKTFDPPKEPAIIDQKNLVFI